MCQKQCRDENGFKCHINTEAHQRQMLLFGQNTGSYTYQFSKDFFDSFMDILKRQFGTKRTKANKVYQQVIAHKDHVHMNSTRWHTLSGFCQWLGKSGICVVDNVDEEWWLTYIDRDPETLERQRKAAKKKKMDKDDEERLLEFVEQQVERDKKRKEGDEGEEKEPEQKFTEFVRENEEDKIKLEMKMFKKAEPPAPLMPPPMKIPRIDNSDTMSERSYKSTKSYKSDGASSSKKSALEEIMEQEERKKEQKNRKNYWLAEGIVVKVMTKSLGSDYYKQKAVVQEVVDKYRGKIKLLETGEKFKIDQEHLETVIPKVDGRVKVLNGAYRDSTAILRSIETARFSVTIEIEKGCFKGRVVSGVPYEDISKIYDK
jgi:DNA/RNA-binding protein KIN17